MSRSKHKRKKPVLKITKLVKELARERIGAPKPTTVRKNKKKDLLPYPKEDFYCPPTAADNLVPWLYNKEDEYERFNDD